MRNIDTAWRRQNTGYLLFAASSAFLRRKLTFMREHGFESISDPQLSLFVNLDDNGASITTLAARASLTKQSIVELVDRAEAAGLVLRTGDAGDKRARIVRLTEQGKEVQDCLHRAIAAAEAGFADVCGLAFTQEFKLGFGRFSASDTAPAADWPDYRDLLSWRSANAGRVLALAARQFAREALAVLHQQGQTEVNEVMLALFRNMDIEGTRLTDLAARAGVTKQSMRELVDRAEALGLIARLPDPDDRRAKRIAFSDAGLAMLDRLRVGIQEAEARLAGQVGAQFLEEARQHLRAFAAAQG